MRQFPEQPLNVPIVPDQFGNTYELVSDWRYEDDTVQITVFAGYRYDGASIPRLLTSASGIYPDGLIRAAAAGHDPLYENNGYDTRIRPHPFFEIIIKDGRKRLSKAEADRLFYKIYKASGEDRRKCVKAYLAVRVGGCYPENVKLAHEVTYND